MKSGRLFRVSVTALCAGLPLCAPLPGQAATDSPYQGIVARNVFALKPPPPPPSPEDSKPPPSKIILTGITTILGNKRALLKTPPAAVKPGQPPQGEQSYILTEGQREGDIEVVAIDEKAGTVKVNNAGSVVVLNFEKDGQKASAAAPGAPPPGLPGAVPPGTHPGAPQIANPYTPAGGFNLPNRPLRAGPGAAANTPGGIPAAGGFGTAAGTAGGLAIGNTTIPAGGTGVPGSDPASLAAAMQRTPEENVALFEANRLKNEALIQSGAKLPHFSAHAYLGGADQAPATPQPVQQTPSLPFAPGVQQLPPTQ